MIIAMVEAVVATLLCPKSSGKQTMVKEEDNKLFSSRLSFPTTVTPMLMMKTETGRITLCVGWEDKQGNVVDKFYYYYICTVHYIHI